MAPLPAPEGLGDAGLTLWTSIADPDAAWNLRADELAVLKRACKVTDRLALLDDQLAVLGSDLTTTGSMGQEVEAPVLGSLARHEALLQRLLGSLKLPDLVSGVTSASTDARKAANARWSKPRTSGGPRPGRKSAAETA